MPYLHRSFSARVYYHNTLTYTMFSWYTPPPKLGLWRERPHSIAVMMYLWETLTVKLCCLEGLAMLVSKALVFLSRIGSVGWVWWFSICDTFNGNTLVLWGWSVINPGVSSGGTSNSMILPQWYWTGPGHDLAGIALHPTSFLCPSRRWGRGEPGELAT